MSAACRPSPTPSTTRSRSWAPPTSRCRTTSGATGGRRRIWACSRLEAILRDASLRDAPQDEVIPHGEERILRVSNHEATRAVRAEAGMKDRNEIADRLAAAGYIADGELATAVSLMQMLRRPLLLE